jgi:hypothetical protein
VDAVGEPSTQADHVVAPSAEPLERRYRDLFGARSVVGALAVVGALSLFGFGLHALAEVVERSTGFETGSAYVVSDTVSFTPAPGWVIDPEGTQAGLVVTATKNGWELKVAGGLTLPDGTLEDFVKVFNDSDKQSDDYTQVGGIESFTTAGGQTGATWAAHGPTLAAQQWYVAEGKDLGRMTARGSASTLASVQPELDAMAASLVVTSAGGGS